MGSRSTRVHDAAYVDAVRTGEPRTLAESQGFTWSPDFARSVIHIWEGHQRAAHFALLRGAQVLHPVSGAHHARRSRGAGFCTFNFLVGAALMLVRAGRAARVCVIDYDAHEGDGTLELGRDLDFLYMHSVAMGVRTEASERIDYHDVRGVVAYRRRYRAVGRLLDRWRPDLVFYQAGMDPHEDDPVGGIPGVDAEVLAERDAVILEALHERRIATVVNLAGGYQDDGTTVGLHVATVRAMARLLGV